VDHNEFELVDDWVWKATDFDFSQRVPIGSLTKGMFEDVFADIKQSFMSVVPEREHHVVREYRDSLAAAEKIKRELQQLDSARIANTPGALLKRHCAPIRDDATDMMVSKVRHEDPASMVAAFLETSRLFKMKIDITNHQIRLLQGKLRLLRGQLLENPLDNKTSCNGSYFVPGYGISRAVILSDIRYFCGPDATVRPFDYHVC
jgi:hypothetical protein